MNGIPMYEAHCGNQRFPESGMYASADEAKAVAEEIEARRVGT